MTLATQLALDLEYNIVERPVKWRSGDGHTHQIYSANQRPAELGGRETIGVTLRSIEDQAS